MPNPPKPHIAHLLPGTCRSVVVPPEYAGCRVVITSATGETFAPLVAGPDATVELPCTLDDERRRLYVRLAPRAA